MAKAHFYTTKPAHLDLEASAMHMNEARKEILEENQEPLYILIEFDDTAPVEEVETQPEVQLAVLDDADDADNTIYYRPSDK